MLETIFLFILAGSCKAAVLILVILGLRKCLGTRVAPSVKHCIWGILATLLILPPSILPGPTIQMAADSQPKAEHPNPLPMAEQDQVIFSNFEVDEIPEFQFDKLERYEQFEQEENDNPVAFLGPLEYDSRAEIPAIMPTTSENFEKQSSSYFHLILGITSIVWLGVVGVLFLFSFMQIMFYYRKAVNSTAIQDDEILEILRSCEKEMKIRGQLEIRESFQISRPLLMGIVRPRILLPSSAVGNLAPEQLKHLFLHELAHHKRRDIFTGWVVSMLCILHWFNPLFWVMVRKMNEDAEEASDQLALSYLPHTQRKEYGLSLLCMAERFCSERFPEAGKYVPGFVGILKSSTQLSRRIKMIKEFRNGKKSWIVLLFVICAAVFYAANFHISRIEAEDTQAAIDVIDAIAEADGVLSPPVAEPSKAGEKADIPADAEMVSFNILAVEYKENEKTASALESLRKEFIAVAGTDAAGTLLEAFRKMEKEDENIKIITQPQVMAFKGQKATIAVGGKDHGFSLEMLLSDTKGTKVADMIDDPEKTYLAEFSFSRKKTHNTGTEEKVSLIHTGVIVEDGLTVLMSYTQGETQLLLFITPHFVTVPEDGEIAEPNGNYYYQPKKETARIVPKEKASEHTIKYYRLKHTKAESRVKFLDRLLNDPELSKFGVRTSADPRTNSLILAGERDHLNFLEKIILALDLKPEDAAGTKLTLQPEEGNSEHIIKIHGLRYAKPSSVLVIMRELFPELTESGMWLMIVDIETNSLIITGSAKFHEITEALITELDEEIEESAAESGLFGE